MSDTQHASEVAIHAIKSRESLGPNRQGDRWYPYHCKKDKPGVWTAGYGHVCTAAELTYYRRTGLTEPEAAMLLAKDLAGRFEPVLRRRAGFIGLAQQEFDSLLSVLFNSGEEPFTPSHSLWLALQSRDRKKIGAAILLYICAGEPAMPCRGLIYRRLEECNLFMTGSYIRISGKVQAVAMLDKLIAMGVLNGKDRYNRIRDPHWDS